MYPHWEDTPTGDRPPPVPEDVVDLVFRIRCPALPVDHAHSLHQAVAGVLPWLDDEPLAAIHTIHGAESGNGWMRPEGEHDVIHLSRRARFVMRLPRERAGQARALENKTLNVAGRALHVGTVRVRLLSRETTLFARHIVSPAAAEDAFLEQAAAMLLQRNIRPKKMMSGREHSVAGPHGKLACRSLMVDGLDFNGSIHLQQHGLGGHQKIGCGIFLPHKSIAAVYQPVPGR